MGNAGGGGGTTPGILLRGPAIGYSQHFVVGVRQLVLRIVHDRVGSSRLACLGLLGLGHGRRVRVRIVLPLGLSALESLLVRHAVLELGEDVVLHGLDGVWKGALSARHGAAPHLPLGPSVCHLNLLGDPGVDAFLSASESSSSSFGGRQGRRHPCPAPLRVGHGARGAPGVLIVAVPPIA